MAPNEVIEATSFAIFPHSAGPILSVLSGSTVMANIRLSTQLIWALNRSLYEALREQYALERRQKELAMTGGLIKETRSTGEGTAWGHRSQGQQIVKSKGKGKCAAKNQFSIH